MISRNEGISIAESVEFEKIDRDFAGRVPPQATDVEMAVLGAMMRDAEAVGLVIEILQDTDFYKPAHRKIYAAMQALFERSEPVDLATVAGELDKTGDLDKWGGRAALVDIADSVFTAANAQAHARLVQDKAMLRMVIGTAQSAIERCHNAPGDVGELLDEVESEVFSITDRRIGSRQDSVDAGTMMLSVLENMDTYRTHGVSRVSVPTTYPRLDHLLGGFYCGDLIVVAARPSIGKTALGVNIAVRLCHNYSLAVGFFSLEMTRDAVGERIVSLLANVNSLEVRNGRLETAMFDLAVAKANAFADHHFFINDRASLSVGEFRAQARRMIAKHQVRILFVDYLQLMHGRGDNREQEVASVSRSLKAVAKDLKVPVVAMAQLNRVVEGRADRKPVLSDLRESGQIEQDADVVLLLHRPEYYGINTDATGDTKNRMDVVIGKQRNGPTGTVHLTFHRDSGRIVSWEGGNGQIVGLTTSFGGETDAAGQRDTQPGSAV